MAWCSFKAQGQLYLILLYLLSSFQFYTGSSYTHIKNFVTEFRTDVVLFT
jgi:hypothetical protein